MAGPTALNRKHAILSASGSDRWLNCTASIRLEQAFKKTTSTYADEGTLAHNFADLFLRWKLDEITEGRYNEAVARLKKEALYNPEMDEEVAKYTSFVWEEFLATTQSNRGSAQLYIEQTLDFSNWVPEGFGTGDAAIVTDGFLHIIDLKYGKGVPVYAENNTQLMLYGLGAYFESCISYEIKIVRLSIVQPRLNSISTWDIAVEDLLYWAENVVKPTAELAIKGEGEPVAGSHCKWCRAKPTCRAFANQVNLSAADDFKTPDTLTDAEVVELYEKTKLVAEYLKTVNEYMHQKAGEGHKFPGYKLVATRGRRRWTNEEDVIDVLADKGFVPKDYLSTKLKGLTDIGNLVSVDFFKTHLEPLVIAPAGPPSLVKDADKRPALGTDQAILDFLE